MKIAAFKLPTSTHISYLDEDIGKTMVEYHKYTQMSEFVDVHFPPLPVEVVVAGQLKQIDDAEQELRNQFQRKLNELAEARATLLSLSHEKQS